MSPQAAATEPEQQKETPERRKARIEGIKKLIQQTSSNVRPEAEAAAFRACALIRKFGLDVVDPEIVNGVLEENHRLKGLIELARKGEDLPDDPPWAQPYTYQPTKPKSPKANPQSKTNPSPFAGGGVGNIFGMGGTAPKASPAPPQPNQPFNPPVAPSTVTPPKGQSQPMAGPVNISAKFNGKCRQCGKVYKTGDQILWMKLQSGGQAVWCPTTTCYHDWYNNTQSAAKFNPFGP